MCKMALLFLVGTPCSLLQLAPIKLTDIPPTCLALIWVEKLLMLWPFTDILHFSVLSMFYRIQGCTVSDSVCAHPVVNISPVCPRDSLGESVKNYTQIRSTTWLGWLPERLYFSTATAVKPEKFVLCNGLKESPIFFLTDPSVLVFCLIRQINSSWWEKLTSHCLIEVIGYGGSKVS